MQSAYYNQQNIQMYEPSLKISLEPNTDQLTEGLPYMFNTNFNQNYN